MREWNPPEKADILVSELLGSFGDNELSPECLDGAQKFLKGKDLIWNYVKLWNSFKIKTNVNSKEGKRIFKFVCSYTSIFKFLQLL